MKPGYVYLICDPSTDDFKIGVTTGNIQDRIKKLQTGNSTELFISSHFYSQHPFRLEKLLHARFRSKNTKNEWFRLDAYDVSSFTETCQKLESDIEALKENPFFFSQPDQPPRRKKQSKPIWPDYYK